VRCGFRMSQYTLTWCNSLSVASLLHKICKTWGSFWNRFTATP
jgi:hypothetical protein